jgi:hypothetical protein
MSAKTKRLTAAAATVVAALVPAAVVAAPQVQAATGPSALWGFSVPSGSSKVADVDGNAQNLTMRGGWGRGSYYVSFNSAPAYGTASGSTFSPGDLEFAFGAVFATTKVATGSNPNVIQGGMGNDAGQFKIALQPVSGGTAICVLKGTGGYKMVKSTRTGLANGAWHEVVCSRQAGSISIAVDGYTTTSYVSPGTIRLTQGRPLLVGSKGATTTWMDQFYGSITCAGVTSGAYARTTLMGKMPC